MALGSAWRVSRGARLERGACAHGLPREEDPGIQILNQKMPKRHGDWPFPFCSTIVLLHQLVSPGFWVVLIPGKSGGSTPRLFEK